MNGIQIIFVVLALTAAVIAAGLAAIAWQRRPAPWSASFTAVMSTISVWSLGYAQELNSSGLAAKIFWSKFAYIGITVLPVFFLLFAISYIGYTRWITRGRLSTLFIIPLLTLFLVWTELGNLIWTSEKLDTSGALDVIVVAYGPWFWIHTAYSYALILTATFLLGFAIWRPNRVNRKQAIVILLATFIPWFSNIFSLATDIPVDLTSIAFSLSGLIIAWGLMRLHIFDVAVVAQTELIDNMQGAMIVLDEQNCILSLNPRAEALLNTSLSNAIGRPLLTVIPREQGRAIAASYADVDQAITEITLNRGGEDFHYDLRISPIRNRHGQSVGRLVVLHDITARVEAERQLRTQQQLSENLIAIAYATMQGTGLRTTLRNALDVAVGLTAAHTGSLFWLGPDETVTHSLLAHEEHKTAEKKAFIDQVMSEGLAGWAAKNKQAAVIYDTLQDKRWLALTSSHYSTRSALAIPILHNGRTLAIFTLTHPQPNRFTEEHAKLLTNAGIHMALALRNASLYDEQRNQAHRQKVLFETLRVVGNYLEPGKVSEAAVKTVAELTGWPRVSIYTADKQGQSLWLQAVNYRTPTDITEPIPVARGVAGRAFRTGQPQIVADVRQDADYLPRGAALGSIIAIPLRQMQRQLGVLTLESRYVDDFAAEDILLAESIGEAIALALANANFHAELNRYASNLSTLYTTSQKTSQLLDLDEILGETLHAALAITGYEAGLISLPDAETGRLRPHKHQGLSTSAAALLEQIGMDNTVCTFAFARNEMVFVGDVDGGGAMLDILDNAMPQARHKLRKLNMRASSSAPLTYQGKPLGVLSLFSSQPRPYARDEAEMQKSVAQQAATHMANARLFQSIEDERSRLQALIASTRDGIILISEEGKFAVANSTALELLQLDRFGDSESWVGRPLAEALRYLRSYAPEVVKSTIAEFRLIQQGNQQISFGEYKVELRQVSWASLPVAVGEASVGRLLVLQDVTEERALQRMQADLTYMMVHDLRNPIGAAFTAATFLQEILHDDLEARDLNLFKGITKSISHALRLVNAILDISRLESGDVPINYERINLPEIIEDVLLGQEPLANEKQITLSLQLADELSCAWADYGDVGRVLQNLIGNAIKFTPKGGSVTIRASQANTSRGERLLVSVADTGGGIPIEIRDKVFNKFTRGNQVERGSGLGLAYCKLILEAHDERIWIEETSEAGTTFTFSLAIAEPLPAEETDAVVLAGNC